MKDVVEGSAFWNNKELVAQPGLGQSEVNVQKWLTVG